MGAALSLRHIEPFKSFYDAAMAAIPVEHDFRDDMAYCAACFTMVKFPAASIDRHFEGFFGSDLSGHEKIVMMPLWRAACTAAMKAAGEI